MVYSHGVQSSATQLMLKPLYRVLNSFTLGDNKCMLGLASVGVVCRDMGALLNQSNYTFKFE